MGILEDLGKVGSIESYGGRGVFVPRGLTAAAVVEGARIIESACDVAHYTALNIACDVLLEGLKSLPVGGHGVPEFEDSSCEKCDLSAVVGPAWES